MSGWRRWARGSVALVAALVGGALVMFLAFYWLALTCDESCNDPSTSWRDDADAWQWTAQFVLAAIAVGAALAGALLLFRRRPRPGGALFAAGVVGALAWAFWML